MRCSHVQESNRCGCSTHHATLRTAPRAGDAQGAQLVVLRILAAERRRVPETCLRHGLAGKQLAAPGDRVLEHGGVLCAARGAQRRAVHSAGGERRNVRPVREGSSLSQRIAREGWRPGNVRKHREGYHRIEIRTGTTEVHDQTSRDDAREEGSGKGQLEPGWRMLVELRSTRTAEAAVTT